MRGARKRQTAYYFRPKADNLRHAETNPIRRRKAGHMFGPKADIIFGTHADIILRPKRQTSH